MEGESEAQQAARCAPVVSISSPPESGGRMFMSRAIGSASFAVSAIQASGVSHAAQGCLATARGVVRRYGARPPP